MILKDGTKFSDLDSAILVAAIVADGVWQELGVLTGVTLTSGSEGHPGDGIHSTRSLHYAENSPSDLCRAVDIRIWDLPDGKASAPRAAKMLRERLTADYDVVLERDHVHVEFDDA